MPNTQFSMLQAPSHPIHPFAHPDGSAPIYACSEIMAPAALAGAAAHTTSVAFGVARTVAAGAAQQARAGTNETYGRVNSSHNCW